MQQSREELLNAYRKMREIRVFEDRVKTEFMAGELTGFLHLYTGQEAVAVGVCSLLTDVDYIGSTHRGHGHCIAKGCDLTGMMSEIFARKTGLCGGKGGSMHIADLDKGMLGANAIVGGSPPLAVGAALSAKVLGKPNVGVAFSGDGASNQGTTFEAMNMAVVLNLPAIFIFENNGYGEGTGASYAVGSNDIAARAEAFGLPSTSVDGSDFFAVQDAAREAIDRARNGGGPSAIEARVTRFEGHFVGDPEQYRASDEVSELRENHDCLKIFRQRVTEAGLLDGAQFDAVDSEVERSVDEATEASRAAPSPTEADLLTDVYVSY